MKPYAIAAIAAVVVLSPSAAVLLAEDAAASAAEKAMTEVKPHPGKRPFAQTLIELLSTRDPDIVSLSIHAKRPDSSTLVVIASTSPEAIGVPSSPEEINILKHETTLLEPKSSDGKTEVRKLSFPFRDGHDEIRGIVVAKFKHVAGRQDWEYYKEASAIIDYLHRRVRFESNLFEPEIIYAPAMWTPPPGRILAQKFIDETLEERQDLVHISVHAKVPGLPGSVQVATDIPNRIGHPSGPADMSVWKKNIMVIETPQDEGVFEVQMPVLDQAGDILGMMIVAFNYYGFPGGDKWKYVKSALEIRDELKKELRTPADLLTPVADS